MMLDLNKAIRLVNFVLCNSDSDRNCALLVTLLNLQFLLPLLSDKPVNIKLHVLLATVLYPLCLYLDRSLFFP